jgi:hypothetical protein
MDVDRARQRNSLDRDLLVMHTIGCKTREQNANERDEADDDTQPNHTVTLKKRVGGKRRLAWEVRRIDEMTRLNGIDAAGILQNPWSVRHCGRRECLAGCLTGSMFKRLDL